MEKAASQGYGLVLSIKMALVKNECRQLTVFILSVLPMSDFLLRGCIYDPKFISCIFFVRFSAYPGVTAAGVISLKAFCKIVICRSVFSVKYLPTSIALIHPYTS